MCLSYECIHLLHKGRILLVQRDVRASGRDDWWKRRLRQGARTKGLISKYAFLLHSIAESKVHSINRRFSIMKQQLIAFQSLSISFPIERGRLLSQVNMTNTIAGLETIPIEVEIVEFVSIKPMSIARKILLNFI